MGFVVHSEKSVLKPTHVLEFLGFVIDSMNMTIRVTDKKVTSLVEFCSVLCGKKEVSIRTIATIVGKLLAACPGVEIGPLYVKIIEIEKNRALKSNRGDYDANMVISEEIISCLNWWIDNLSSQVRHISHGNPDIVVHCDASNEGWGGWISNGNICRSKTRGRWSEEELLLHINQLELLAVLFSLRSLLNDVSNVHIRVMSDNTTAVHYIDSLGGVKSPECNDIARKIWFWCIERNVWISAAYVKGTDNVEADFLSRHFADNTEWSLNEGRFAKINDLWGPFEIDLFASRLNKKVEEFVSWKPDPQSDFVDAFSVAWSTKYFYAFPPFAMIPKCLQKIYFDRAEGVMVVPRWTTQPWYTKICNMATDIPRYIRPGKKVLYLPGVPGELHPLHQKLGLMVIRVSGRNSKGCLSGRPRSSYSLGEDPQSLSTRCTLGSGQSFVEDGGYLRFKPL